jgi:DNA-binding winged helix-turn-helix (wHTH) protein
MRFGECVLDTGTRELLRGGAAVHLSPKAFRLLEALLESRPQAVSRAALHERLWPQTFVHEANLPNLVAEVRTALGDEARRSRFVRTVHGYGYAFCGEALVAQDAPPASGAFVYRLESPRESASFGDGEHLLGRGVGSAVRLRSRSVSRRHALVRAHAGQAVIEDLGSRNGTFVAGNRVTGSTRIAHGDEVRIGSVTLTFVVSAPSEATGVTEAPPE